MIKLSQKDKVKIWEDIVKIESYPVGEADKNPMFLDKRVYQGSSGKVYPLPVIEKIYDEKIEKEYKMIYLENEYLRIEIMPELGGRIQRAYDKTNDYDFVYYNPVIKPALVGLAGPWIAGGIEFNWPQHHRPSTFSPVEYSFEENDDGSAVVWVSEIDRMYGTKGMAGFKLYPDKAYLEIIGQLYNKTELPQTFLWWVNPAVAVNEYYKSIFPPDVNAVFDHGKRDVSKFPIATGEYYKVDYSAGVDISKYKNISVPTSYMAYHSDYDFVGGYDYSEEAGILHVANHHISPGKKQWTWGTGDFGQRWYQNLTDYGTGEYIELMTGVFTDNQPDFTWMQPQEEKTFKQYFLPYKDLGEVKNASKDYLLNLEIDKKEAEIAVYSTSKKNNLKIVLSKKNNILFSEKINLDPQFSYNKKIEIDSKVKKSDYTLKILDADNNVLITYSPAEKKLLKTPDPAEAAKKPEEIQTNEELYLTAVHLEQYRHATYAPDPYYLEGLKRDPNDIRINNAYGRLLLRRGLFIESEKHFDRAVNRLTNKNPNPYDSEAYYNLGLSLKYQKRYHDSFAAFHKAIWSGNWQDSGYYELAALAYRKKEVESALEYIEKSIIKNYHNTKSRNLKTALLRKSNKLNEAEKFAEETLKIDRLDFAARSELYFIKRRKGESEAAENAKNNILNILRNDHHNFLELACDYGNTFLYQEAINILEIYLSENKKDELNIYPMIYYYLAYYNLEKDNINEAKMYYNKAAAANSDYCFPNKLTSINVLQSAIKNNTKDAKALYYLGNLYYDKKQYEKAIKLWEKSRDIDDSTAVIHRNLALSYYNKLDQKEKSKEFLEKAFEINSDDSRILYELDQLYKKLGYSNQKRKDFLDKYMNLVEERDDLYSEYVTLENNLSNHKKALELLLKRHFHPWEGGEGKVTSQYRFANIELAKENIEKENFSKAKEFLEAARNYPENLGEGKLPIAKDNDIDYYTAVIYKKNNECKQAKIYFEKAAVGSSDLSDMLYYNDQPAHMIFYQGLALEELGRKKAALSKFNSLYDYGEKHFFDEVEIDYFAVSLPDFLVFDADLEEKNKIHCKYLMGLSLIAKGKIEEAQSLFNYIKERAPYHQGIKRKYLMS
jgi:tetratricopeptide (TPR) repeat protein